MSKEILERLQKAREPKPKKVKKPIPKKSAKKIATEKAEKLARGDNETELQKFFKNAMRFMTGRCAETGNPTNRTEYRFAINSICHILSQQQCKSVKTHPLNWIELEEGFHKKFDAMNWDERAKLKCWPKIQERLIMIWPDLADEEKRHFPHELRDYVESDYPFEA